MDQFEDQLSNLADLDDATLGDLESELVQAFDTADESGDVDTMSQLADAIDQVRDEIARRGSGETDTDTVPEAPAAESDEEMMAASAATLEAAPDTATAEPEATTEPDAGQPAAEPTAETEVQTEAPTDPPADEASTDTPAEATAEATDPEPTDEAGSQEDQETMDPQDSELDGAAVPEEHQPELEETVPQPVIRAGGDIAGVTAGSELDGLDAVADAMTDRINSLRNVRGGGDQLIVASIETALEDESRTLRRGDIEGNSKKIREVMELVRDPEAALTAAANGWCAPRTPLYNLFGVGETDRPVKDSLPGFNADRGGIVYSTPPALADGNYGAGVWAYTGSEWQASSVAASGTPADDTKVLFEATCPAELTADLEAITSQLKFDNPTARAYPELVRRNMELALIAHARFAEMRLLRTMWNAGTALTITPSVQTGVARDLLISLRGVAASVRNRHRTNPDATVDIWAPAWLADAIANDLTLGESEAGQLTVARSEIEGWLRDINVNVTWYWDDIPGNGTSQLFSTKKTFPTAAAIVAALPGTFMFLDGGTLDIGVVRDGDLVGTNKYIEFSETFEKVAFMGLESASCTLSVKAIGASADFVDTSAGVTV